MYHVHAAYVARLAVVELLEQYREGAQHRRPADVEHRPYRLALHRAEEGGTLCLLPGASEEAQSRLSGWLETEIEWLCSCPEFAVHTAVIAINPQSPMNVKCLEHLHGSHC